jgi:hypothetical protein
VISGFRAGGGGGVARFTLEERPPGAGRGASAFHRSAKRPVLAALDAEFTALVNDVLPSDEYRSDSCGYDRSPLGNARLCLAAIPAAARADPE